LDLGFRVRGVGSGVYGFELVLRFRVQGLGFMGSRVYGVGFGV
jgi:hypothetical protein